MRLHLLTLLAVSAASPVVAAEPDRALLRAAFVIGAYDHYAARCSAGRGFDAAQSREAQAWEAANDVAGLRRHLAANPLPPDKRRDLDTALQRTIAQVDGHAAKAGADACAAALVLIRTDQARIAGAAGAPAAAEAPVAAAPVAPPAPAADTRALVAQIDSFAFDSRPTMGAGGFIGLDIYPVVLFKDGSALTEVKHLAEGGTLAELGRRHARDFTRWRRSGGELQLQKEKGWEKLPFTNTYGMLPAGLVLDGLYRASGGTGNVAVGGTASVSAWTDYRFSPDGQVLRGGGAGGRAEAGGTSVVTGSAARGRQGRYRIDGLALHIDWADGAQEHRILITDPKDPRGTVWIDGVAYVQRKR